MTLAETQVVVRKGLLIIIAMTIVYYSGRYGINQGIGLYHRMFPKEQPPPAASFGILPKLKMKSINIEGQPNYVLDTQDGRFPTFPDRLKVYPTIKPTPTLVAEQNMKALAQNLGFNGESTKLSSSDYRWVDGDNDKTMNANVISEDFQVDTKVDKLSSILTNTPTITESDASNMVTQYIRSKSLVNSVDSANLKTSTIPSIISIGRLRQATLTSEKAKLVKVNVYRNLIDNNSGQPKTYIVLGPDPKNSLMNFFVTNSKNKVFTYPLVGFDYWETDYANGSSYYISSIQSIWNDAIAQNKGIVSHLKLDDVDYYQSPKSLDVSKIEIRNIYLAYYETPEFYDYLQPIYVFEGRFETVPKQGELAEEGDIVIYYPAVRGDYVNNSIPETPPE